MTAQPGMVFSCGKGLPIRLVPMSKDQYEEFIRGSVDRQIRDQILAGRLDPEKAKDTITARLGKMLPQGMETPGHEFFAIESAETEEHVGDLWFTTMRRAQREVGFVMDIYIHPEHRRHGYGAAAFKGIERLAVEKGLDEMTLDVAGHNSPARALYQKIGYREVGVSMAKRLDR